MTKVTKSRLAPEKEEGKIQKLLDAANRKIAQHEKKVSDLLKSISSLTKQLDKYRSVRGQLSVGALKQENSYGKATACTNPLKEG